MNTASIKYPGDLPSDEVMEVSGHAKDRIKRWTSQELFAGERELVITHAGSEYRLRLTSQGKLVLTK